MSDETITGTTPGDDDGTPHGYPVPTPGSWEADLEAFWGEGFDPRNLNQRRAAKTALVVIGRLRAQFIADCTEQGYDEDEAREMLAQVESGNGAE